MTGRWRQLQERVQTLLGERGLRLVLAGLVVVACGWGFLSLADEVVEGETQTLDEWAVRSLRDPQDPSRLLGPRYFTEVMRDLTALGGLTVLTLVSLGVAGYLALARKYRALLLVLVSTAGGVALSLVLKNAFSRQRPQLVPHLSITATSSFPSAHSMQSAVVYLTLGTMLAQLMPNRTLRLYVLALSSLIPVLVGMSRVFMGVHYPTDVLAGWMVGLAWAVLCGLVMRLLQRRGAVESTATLPDAPKT